MSKWYATCVEEEKEPEELKELHVVRIDGITCQHLKVLMTHLSQKHSEWQERRDGKSKEGPHQ